MGVYPANKIIVVPTDSYPTIEAAIDAADAIGDGRVLVAPGAYTEDLTIPDGVGVSPAVPDSVTITGDIAIEAGGWLRGITVVGTISGDGITYYDEPQALYEQNNVLMVGPGMKYKTIPEALAVAAAGDVVVIYPGTYEVSAPLTPAAGVTMQGVGMPIIKPTSAYTSGRLLIPISGLTIDGIFFQTVRYSPQKLINETNATITDLTIRNCKMYGGDACIEISNGTSRNVRIENNILEAQNPIFMNETQLLESRITGNQFLYRDLITSENCFAPMDLGSLGTCWECLIANNTADMSILGARGVLDKPSGPYGIKMGGAGNTVSGNRFRMYTGAGVPVQGTPFLFLYGYNGAAIPVDADGNPYVVRENVFTNNEWDVYTEGGISAAVVGDAPEFQAAVVIIGEETDLMPNMVFGNNLFRLKDSTSGTDTIGIYEWYKISSFYLNPAGCTITSLPNAFAGIEDNSNFGDHFTVVAVN